MTLTADGGYRPFNEADKPEGFAIRDVGMTLEIDREDVGTLLKKYYDYGTYTQTGACLLYTSAPSVDT